MARKPQVRYWATRGTWVDEQGQSRKGGWWTTICGKQIELSLGPNDFPEGPCYRKAIKTWLHITGVENAEKAGDANTCRVIFEHHVRAIAAQVEPETLRGRKGDLDAFCQSEMADWAINKLTVFAVEKWMRGMRSPRTIKALTPRGKEWQRTVSWGDSRVCRVVKSLKAAFNWAVDAGLISKNPLEKLSRPSARSRSRDCIVSPAMHELALQHAFAQLREFIVCLESTGARPGELLDASAADWDDRLGALVFFARSRRRDGETGHKTDKKGKDRRIFFTGEALEVMRRRVNKYPSGKLWRPTRGPGKEWCLSEVDDAFARLGAKIGMPNITPYSYRHTFATHWLESGGTIDDLAALMGNSPAVIRLHYAHLLDNTDRLRELAERFNAAKSDTSPSVLPFASGQ